MIEKTTKKSRSEYSPASKRIALSLSRPVCTENLNSDIVMKKSPEYHVETDCSSFLNRARDRRIFIQRPRCSDVVVVTSIGSQNPTQMHLTKNDDMIQGLAADRSDQPFGKAFFPRRGRGGRLVPDAHGAQSACDDGSIDPIAIPDHVARSPVPRKSLGYLTCNPLRGWVCCDIDPDEVSAIETNDHEGVKQVEANGRDNEQIHGGNFLRVIPQEGPPSLAGRSTPLDHVLCDA